MNKSEFVHKIESFFPVGVIKVYRRSKPFRIWMHRQLKYKKEIMRIRLHGFPIKVLFIVKDTAEWKYESLYQLMAQDPVFSPQILVCPIIEYLRHTPQQAYEIFIRTFDVFSKRGYNVVKACEKLNDDSIGVETLQPDIIFYSNLWTNYTHEKYNHIYLQKYLKCYVDYGFCSIAEEWGYASPFHRLMWRYFCECEDIKQLALAAQPWDMRNAVVTGYPIYDEYMVAKGDTSGWKSIDAKYKRIIWAPHHTIEGHQNILRFSTFIENADAMLEIAEKYKGSIQFAFKPHPLLLQGLYEHPRWGKEKADAYYNRWASGENTSLIEGTYVDLFKSSDAMIHDCGSFIVEYLYTQKPVLYLGKGREEQSNNVGKNAYNCHYHGIDKNDIEHFLNEVVIKGNDPMKDKRLEFYNDVLLPPNGLSVAENIVKNIKKSMWIQNTQR